jgi:hypothetical protein
MILPTKHIPTRYSYLGLGAIFLQQLDNPKTVTFLWDNVRRIPEVGTFERFSLTLDFLFAIGAIDFENDLLRKKVQ